MVHHYSMSCPDLEAIEQVTCLGSIIPFLCALSLVLKKTRETPFFFPHEIELFHVKFTVFKKLSKITLFHVIFCLVFRNR